MSLEAIFVLGIIGSGVITIAGIYAVAIRRGPSAGSTAPEEPRSRDSRADGFPT